MRSARFWTCVPWTMVGLLLAVLGFTQMSCAQSPTGQSDDPDPRADLDALAFDVAFPNLTFERPVFLTTAPGMPDRIFVIEQRGRVLSFPHERAAAPGSVEEVLNIEDQVRRAGNEEGLLGLAFHPDFAQNHQVFLHYSAEQGARRNILSRWQFDPGTGRIAPGSEEILLEVSQPYSNHNGGHIAFGPDGYLYLALGDGGAGGDPRNNGQNLATLLGSILRIDVDRTEGDKPYAIPDDNPFVDRSGARPEIYAYGLRNAWRFSFDVETGTLWAGDVGQNSYEEIDIIEKGGNYGWNIMEGTHEFEPNGRSREDLIAPVIEYGRSAGISVTGGYVYRGEAVPSARGTYIYADYGSGRVWGLHQENGQVQLNEQFARVSSPASFGVDAQGEVYICSFDGKIYRLVSDGADS